MIQTIIWVLKNHEDRITNNEQEISALKKENALLKKKILEIEERQNKTFIIS